MKSRYRDSATDTSFYGSAGRLKGYIEMAGVIDTNRGFVVLFLRGRQPGLTQSFESVKPRLAQRLMAEGRGRALEELVVSLKNANPAFVDDSLIKTIPIESGDY